LVTLAIPMPAVISADLRLNEPRYASLPNIMKAKRKPINTIELSSLGLSLQTHVEVLSVSAPAGRSAGIRVETVEELVNKLHEAKVL